MTQYVYVRKAVEDLVPGMVLGKMLVTSEGKNFLNEGAVLTLRIIQTLQMWGFRQIEIREEVPFSSQSSLTEEAFGNTETQMEVSPEEISREEIPAVEEPEPVEAPAIQVEVVPEVYEVEMPPGFQAYYQAAVQILKQTLGRARFLKESFGVSDIRQMVGECVMPLIEDTAVMDNLQMMPHSEDYLYHHSVDVGVISGCLGLWLGRPFKEIEEIILGGLLHDVGKALIPLKVLNKQGALTEEEMNLVRFHSTRGYKFLKESSDVNRNILLCTLQHHERMDGSGYPLAVRGDKIHPYAKIIAVADVFDAMIAKRGYGKQATPYEAVEIMKHEMYGKLDIEICTLFLEKICQRFVGDLIQLSDGRRGEVVFLNQYDNTRPIVRTQEGEFIDLDKRRDINICKMLHS